MPAKTTMKKTAGRSNTEFAVTFNTLRTIIAPYAHQQMRVVHDTPDYYCLETTFPLMQHKSVMFAAVRTGKGYVSYHLVPLYMNPRLEVTSFTDMNRSYRVNAMFNFSEHRP